MELFTPEFGLVFWMFVAFALLYGVLSKYAWPYIIKSMEERAELIDRGVAYAEQAQQQLAGATRQAEALLGEARQQQADILRQAAQMRTQIIEQARADAAVEAKKVADNALTSIEQARKESEKQLRQEVTEIALQIAEKVLRNEVKHDDAQRQLVEKYLNEVETRN